MIVTERKKSGDDGKPMDASKEDRPEKKSIGLAANLPGIRIESYSSRWGIETGCAKTECRAKTRTADLATRMPVLLLLDDTVQRVNNCQGTALSRNPGCKTSRRCPVFKECMTVYLREPKSPSRFWDLFKVNCTG